MSGRRILVMTVVHHPEDGRIRARQIEALLAAGWEVTYAAPWTGYDLDVPQAHPEGRPLRCIDLPRAQGRRRLLAQRGARQLLQALGGSHDVVLIHDPELLAATVGLRLPPVVWDVHEDTPAALEVRSWLPGPLRGMTAALVRLIELVAERRVTLLLADADYASRFRRAHAVVPNSTWIPVDPGPAAVPDDGVLRVVYLGSITLERGALELVHVGRRLAAQSTDPTAGAAQPPMRLEVMGPAHGPAAELMRTAHEAGVLRWFGYVPNETGMTRIRGALAGLSLLHDEANFRPSMPTKVVEYLAQGVPVISTPLPMAERLLRRSDGGAIIPFSTPEEVADDVVEILDEWAADPTSARAAGGRGRELVRTEWSWEAHARSFLTVLEGVVAAHRPSAHT